MTEPSHFAHTAFSVPDNTQAGPESSWLQGKQWLLYGGIAAFLLLKSGKGIITGLGGAAAGYYLCNKTHSCP